jgi:adenylylsulfate kinase
LNRRDGSIPALVITGPVGAGKSTIMRALSELLEQRSIRHIAIDMDHLRWVFPTPPGDRFGACLGFNNLAAIWPNFREMEPECVVIADVVESRAGTDTYLAAMPGTRVTVIRLHVPMPVILQRLEGRQSEQTIEWYRQRAPELQEILERDHIGDLVIDVGDRTPEDTANEILQRVGPLQGET